MARRDWPWCIGRVLCPLSWKRWNSCERVLSSCPVPNWMPSGRNYPPQALALGSGVCQDFAHLFIAACRGCGLPARYVSGYVNQPGEIATHAWAQVWGGGAIGWVDVDPTHGRFADDGHVVTAVGRDYSDVPPNRGAWKGRAEETIAVSVKVEVIQRLPGDWIELDGQNPRPATSAHSTSRPTRSGGLSHQNQVRPVLRHQASQQQQETDSI